MMQRVEELEGEVSFLKTRLARLEQEAGYKTPGDQGSMKARRQAAEKVSGASGAGIKDVLTREGLESLIGGKLLNRVGIIVLLAGIAYFLKYSFDNNWINETGRIIIGLLAGTSLMVAGDLAMKRGYNYFSQGLSGGGIAVIYLTVYAGTNFYHIFNPGISFTLLALTALSGGILSVRQNAYGVALLSTLGGFMSPFLIGSSDPHPVPLLGYVALLDLAVLFLAYYKNWRSLNIISFIGTALVYIIYMSSYNSPAEVAVNGVFLLVFFVIFGSLAFLYNVRNKRPTEIWDVLLIVLNTAFFLAASLENLRQYDGWHGLFAVFLAAVFLLTSLWLQKRKTGDSLLTGAMLGTGLALVTVAIPLQMDGEWCTVFWLAEAIILFYLGVRARNIWVQRAGLSLLVLTSVFQMSEHVYKAVPVVNLHSLGSYLAIAGLFFAFSALYRDTGLKDRKLAWPLAVFGIIMALDQLSWEVTNFYRYYKLGHQYDFAVSLVWVAAALVLMLIGMLKNIKGFRLAALALFGLTVGKVLLFDLQHLAMVLRVIILLVVGVILVGVSFVYQRKDGKGKGDGNENG